MQIDMITIERHAGEKLRKIESQPSPAQRLAALKKFLKIETQRLSLRHRFGVNGAQIVAARSLIVDLLIERIARTAVEEKLGGANAGQFAVVALGGYGRRELAPHSDIDIMFLHQGRRDSVAAAKLSEAILYLLWDIGFNVGHSVRGLGDCVSMAREDVVSRNSMIDARLLWGDAGLFEQLTERLDEEIFEKQKPALLDELLKEREARYAKFGSAACLQEPNIKESAGGLRDLHELLWASRVAYGQTTLEGLIKAEVIPERDAKAIGAAYEFLLRVRNDLHFLTSRRTDLLSLDLQQQVARNLGYADSERQQASEIFMRDYYLHARRLHRLCESHLRRAIAARQKKNWFARSRSTTAAGGFVMSDGTLDTANAGEELDGARMMMAFGYAQATGAGFSVNLQDAIQSSLPAVNRAFRSSTDGAQSFLKMLRARGRVAATLRLMHELDFLGKFLPEFGRVTCLVQHDLYHRYTVDEHTLRTIEALDELAGSRGKQTERYRNLYGEISDAATLHLGLLMHDIGKGLGGNHTEKGIRIAERAMARLGLEAEMTEQALFLIRHHLTMSHIAQRRDLSDDKVIGDFAEKIGTLDNLNMLTLLTYGDINGVGPGVWNEWKDSLLWELYTKARAVLSPDKQPERGAEELRERVGRMLASEIDVDVTRKHFGLLPEDYARSVPPQTIIEHIRLAHTLNSRPVKTSWRVDTQMRCADLHLCAPNRRGLFAGVAGTLTAQGVNILSVQLNTRADGIAIDSFKVRDTAGEPITDPARWEQIDSAIRRAIGGELDVAAAVEKRLRSQTGSRFQRRKALVQGATRISWDNQSSGKSTILELRTSDRLGLAYKIANTLTSLDLDIVFAKVATEKHLALDVFYVTNAAGEKLADADLPVIEDAIRNALSEKRN
ncbi:MAG: Bifunctional uridylyltransferase/uridylyl-removing enzyme [Acidobacteria bacterium]|nr:Bifunctional uridylyltransferase/uridylyl-removing enzyme [Acidobacteriota bacterium]